MTKLSLLSFFVVLHSSVVFSSSHRHTFPDFSPILHRLKRNRQFPCKEHESYYFNVQPKSITVREGGRAYLECNVSNRCNVQFRWTMDRKLVLNSTRRYQNGSNLVITRVNRTLDGGEFHCVTTLRGISRESSPAVAHILWLTDNATVRLTDPSPEEAQSGNAKTITLECEAPGSDPSEIEYKWMRNGRVLKAKPGLKPSLGDKKGKNYRIEGGTLVLENASVDDNGVYSCVAENSYGVTRSKENFVLRIKGDTIPSMEVLPSDVTAKIGSEVRFHCEYANATRMRWKKMGVIEDYGFNGRIHQEEKSGDLVVKEVEMGDASAYECLGYGTEEKQPPQTYVGFLEIASLGQFKKATTFEPVRNLYAVGQGKRFEVACVPPEGNPPPRAYWTRKGKTLTDSGRTRADNLRLVIDKARLEDEGDYVCVAENMAGKREHRLRLYISRQPTMEYHPAGLEVVEGATGFFECKYKGSEYPVTVVDWEKNGSPLQVPQQERLRIKYDRQNGTLQIKLLRLSDAGRYQCVVKTADQPDLRSKVAVVKVREKLKFSPKPVDKKLDFGTNAQIHCSARGDQAPMVKWMKLADLNLAGNVTRKYKPQLADKGPDRIDKNGTLFFKNVKYEDAGVYMCVAVNTAQGVINATIKVHVYDPPRFLMFPKNRTLRERSDIWFDCNAVGTPNPKMDWYFENTPVGDWKFKNYKLYPNKTLHIKSVRVENAGKFSCWGVNAAAFKRKEALVCVILDNNVTHCGTHKPMIQGGRETVDGIMGTKTEEPINPTPIAIAVGAAVGYILLMVCLVAFCAYKRRSSNAKNTTVHINTPMYHDGNESAHGPLVPSANGSVKTGMNGHLTTDRTTTGTPTSRDMNCSPGGGGGGKQTLFDILAYSRDNLDHSRTTKIGSGIYGDVLVAVAHRIKEDEETSMIIVKTLIVKDTCIHQQMREEMDLFTKTEHPHVAKMLGICRDREPIYVMFEYSDWGSLKNYLSYSKCHNRPVDNGMSGETYPPPLTEAQIISLAYQIAQAMEHISDMRFVHKDLAARNILISSDYKAKVSSLSLQNDPFIQEYYAIGSLVYPLRWMPAEALLDGEWSMKSDVWSFGVVVWEMYNVGDQPHGHLSNDSVVEELKKGDLKLPLGPAIHPLARDVMLRSWENDPRKRPDFTWIRDKIAELHVESLF